MRCQQTGPSTIFFEKIVHGSKKIENHFENLFHLNDGNQGLVSVGSELGILGGAIAPPFKFWSLSYPEVALGPLSDTNSFN